MLLPVFTGFSCFFIFPAFYLFLILPGRSHRKEIAPFLGRDIAHRGLHNKDAGIPENSMLSFKEAVKQGLAIEIDIHLTADHQIVVFHDNTLRRMCGADGTVEEHTLAELQKLYLLGTAERIPLFSEVLSYVNGRVPLLIELKMPTRNPELCARTWKLLKDYPGPYMIQSFNCLAVRWFYRHAPQVLRGQLSSALTRSKTDKEPYLLRFCVQHLLSNLICRPDFISYCLADSRNLGLILHHRLFHTPIAVWTLRTPKAYKKAHRLYDMYIFEIPARTFPSKSEPKIRSAV